MYAASRFRAKRGVSNNGLGEPIILNFGADLSQAIWGH